MSRWRVPVLGKCIPNGTLITMAADKLVLDLTLVLPDIPDERDACVERLTSLLQSKDIDRAHVVREDGKVRLCLHYDPERIGLAEVRQLAATAGASIGKRYVHESLRIDGMDCPTCANATAGANIPAFRMTLRVRTSCLQNVAIQTTAWRSLYP